MYSGPTHLAPDESIRGHGEGAVLDEGFHQAALQAARGERGQQGVSPARAAAHSLKTEKHIQYEVHTTHQG